MKILLTQKAYLKLKYYTQGCEEEISGIGQSEKIDKETIRITDFFLFKQEVSGASTDLDKSEVAKFYQEQNKKGIDTSNYNVWWHSHCDMGTFWSSTDDSTIDTAFLVDSYIVAIESNHKLDFKARVDVFNPFRFTIEASVEIEMEDKKLKKNIDKEIKDKVSSGFCYTKGEAEQELEPLTPAEELEFDELETKQYSDGLIGKEAERYMELYDKAYSTGLEKDEDDYFSGRPYEINEGRAYELNEGKITITKNDTIKGRSVVRRKKIKI